MMRSLIQVFLFLGLLVALGQAATLVKKDTPSRLVEKRATTCTPTAGGSSSTDDVPAIEAAIKACPAGVIYIKAGVTYYINSQLSFAGCAGCTFQLEGTLKVASDLTYWSGKAYIIQLSGITNAKITSTTGTGLIDANGQDAYDALAADSSFSRVKTVLSISSSTGVTVSGITIKNPPNAFNSISSGSSNVVYSSVTLSAVSKSTALPKNSDGWDVSGTYVTIKDCTVVNDDDCVAMGSGANYVTITNLKCTGSHGISIGSLGKTHGNTDTVKNVYVNGLTMTNCAKAAGIKLWPAGPDHGTAVVSNVTWTNVVSANSDYAFQIQSCYGETAAYCASYPSTAQLSGIVASKFSGTTSTHYEPVVANIDCPSAGTCGVKLSSFTVTPPSGSAVYQCANTPSTIGVTCTSGASG